MAQRVCPWWMGYWLVNPFRKFLQCPDKILSPYVRLGMRVLDIGSGMGFFCLPLARLAGPKGAVTCVDLQDRMLRGLVRRAQRYGLADSIEPRFARPDSLMIADLADTIDFALAFAVAHEVEDKERFFREIYCALRHKGKLLFAEPTRHVPLQAFEHSVNTAVEEGFEIGEHPDIRMARAVILIKN